MNLRSQALAAATDAVSRTAGSFRYSLHKPANVAPGSPPPRLLVVIHGSDYRHEEMCRFFAGLADETGCVVLAPLFTSVETLEDSEGYKFLRSDHASYDLALLAMIKDVVAECGITDDRYFLYGFSGGAQFAHRFFYVYPQQLHALAVAAPGMVTLIDQDHDCWVGTADLRQIFGHDVDLDALRGVPVQLVVGADDVVPHFGDIGPEAYNHAGKHRVERLRSLARNYRANGIATEHVEVAGVAHDFERLAALALPFFRSMLAGAGRQPA